MVPRFGETRAATITFQDGSIFKRKEIGAKTIPRLC